MEPRKFVTVEWYARGVSSIEIPEFEEDETFEEWIEDLYLGDLVREAVDYDIEIEVV